ncbi:LOW QUALITY PROTEIN: hypothetical protein OSB04_un000377 [Centaurea solstitialis]|uniref:CCHC-type domain-containing protein n=1 Tax=Centaurea solstitialis TaxID=347529 RepID=A0AA38SNR8_9ASTR|nr:LOW QUALITY PROTEIN: hypothetical protein OSB04_un000377 [Centaurea solstitialis]
MSLANRRDDMSMGSETKAPVLFKDEYELWVSRFKLYIRIKKDGDKILHSILHGPHPIPVTTLDGREVPKDFSEMDVAERERYMIDVEAQNYLIQAIPNEIFRKLDSYDESAKIHLGSTTKDNDGFKGNQMRITNLMDRYENFRMKEDESLEEAYDRFVELMNDMKKNNIIRSEMDYIVKFINNLSSDWKQFSRFVKQHKVLNELKVYEVYENLLLFEEEKKTETDTLALLAEKEKAKKKVRKGKAKVFEACEDDEEEDEEEYDEDEKDQMLQSLLSLTEVYKKKYYNKSGSNNRRFSTRGGRGFNRNYMQSSQGYPPRVENQYVDKYATKKEEAVKDTPERTEEKKGQAGIICYKCGKTGHIAKGCTTKMTKVELLRKKLELAEKQEQGLVLMADDEEWLDYSDNDDQAQMCFMGLMEEESESDEDIESDGETSTVRSVSLDDHNRKMLEVTTLIHNKNKELELVILKQTNEITDLLQQKEQLSSQCAQLQQSVNEFETIRAEHKSQKLEIDFLTISLSVEKENVSKLNKMISDLDLKLHKIGQTEHTIFLNKQVEFRDYYSKEGLGYTNPNYLKKTLGVKNPNYLQKALKEKAAFYDLTSMLMSKRFPSLKGFQMKEEFSEMQHMKLHDPMYHDSKYHRVKFVYNDDTLKIKSNSLKDDPESHLAAVKPIFRYLKRTPYYGIWYPKGLGFELQAYTDADYGGCNMDRKSTSGHLEFLGNKLVSWASKKQQCVSTSTAESEYVAAASCCSQVLWMQSQLRDYGLEYKKIPIYCDSKSAIAISANPVQHSKTKHIDIRYHFLKDNVEKENIELYFVNTEYQLADLFTKALDEKRFNFLISRLAMEDYIFPDSDDMAIPDILSVQSTPHNPNVDVDRQLLRPSLFLPSFSNNVPFNPHARMRAPVITAILRNHPLYTVLTKMVEVPMIYVQQVWNTLQFHADPGNHHFTAKLDHYTISFGVNKFRRILGFPEAPSRPNANQFEPFASLAVAMAGVESVGHLEAVNAPSQFNKSNLPPTYNTLFTILSRCLTGKRTAQDTATQSFLTLFYGVLFNKHYDYASLIFHDLKELLAKR